MGVLLQVCYVRPTVRTVRDWGPREGGVDTRGDRLWVEETIEGPPDGVSGHKWDDSTEKIQTDEVI